MKIIIPDDYQDIVDRLSCFSLLAGHDVVRHREPAANLDQLVEHQPVGDPGAMAPQAVAILARGQEPLELVPDGLDEA